MKAPPTVLHVDDDESCLALSRASFERALPDVDLLTRDDPDEALATLSVESVDAVVSDSLELADGTPFVEAVRNAYPSVPIVLYTGQAFTDAAPVVTRAGVTEYVQKRAGSTMNDLVGRVDRLVADADSTVDTDRFRYTPPGDDEPPPTTRHAGHESVGATDTWTVLAHCDPTSVDDLVVTLVDALGDRADARPLVELFDAEALARVLDSDDDASTEFRIRLDAREFVVTDDGVVASRPLTTD
jgi:DNA-binding response OmpR family regulator